MSRWSVGQFACDDDLRRRSRPHLIRRTRPGAATALPVERLGEPPSAELTALFARRARSPAPLVDLGLVLS